jgi:hypothetical protein
MQPIEQTQTGRDLRTMPAPTTIAIVAIVVAAREDL